MKLFAPAAGPTSVQKEMNGSFIARILFASDMVSGIARTTL